MHFPIQTINGTANMCTGISVCRNDASARCWVILTGPPPNTNNLQGHFNKVAASWTRVHQGRKKYTEVVTHRSFQRSFTDIPLLFEFLWVVIMHPFLPHIIVTSPLFKRKCTIIMLPLNVSSVWRNQLKALSSLDDEQCLLQDRQRKGNDDVQTLPLGKLAWKRMPVATL